MIFNWILSFFAGRDTTQLLDLDNPRGAFVAAATPAPKPAAAEAKPADAKPVEAKPADVQKNDSKDPVAAKSK